MNGKKILQLTFCHFEQDGLVLEDNKMTIAEGMNTI